MRATKLRHYIGSYFVAAPPRYGHRLGNSDGCPLSRPDAMRWEGLVGLAAFGVSDRGLSRRTKTSTRGDGKIYFPLVLVTDLCTATSITPCFFKSAAFSAAVFTTSTCISVVMGQLI